MTVNKLILGDNLEILEAMEAESVDLVYLDPPFFSNRNYEVVWRRRRGSPQFPGPPGGIKQSFVSKDVHSMPNLRFPLDRKNRTG
jgi:DNA modification methylase